MITFYSYQHWFHFCGRLDLSLGQRVLYWCKKELLKLAHSLELIDKHTQLPYCSTAYDLSKNNNDFYPAAYLDKKSCRLIFGQIAQQSRLRSLFVKYSLGGIADNIPKAVKSIKAHGDEWTDQLSWWDESDPIRDDYNLLLCLLNLGFSNFDHANTRNNSFRKRNKVCKLLALL